MLGGFLEKPQPQSFIISCLSQLCAKFFCQTWHCQKLPVRIIPTYSYTWGNRFNRNISSFHVWVNCVQSSSVKQWHCLKLPVGITYSHTWCNRCRRTRAPTLDRKYRKYTAENTGILPLLKKGSIYGILAPAVCCQKIPKRYRGIYQIPGVLGGGRYMVFSVFPF